MKNGLSLSEESMKPIETHASSALRQARHAIEAASSRDHARLHGLWRRWNTQPQDAKARDAFAAALAQSVARREKRAAALPQGEVDPGLPIATRRGRDRRADPRTPGHRDRRRDRFGQDHAAAEAVPGGRARRRRHDRLHAAAPHRRARGRASRRRGTAGAAGRRRRFPGALQRQRRARHRDQVHDRRHPARGDPVGPLALGLRHDHRRRGARAQPQHRFPARLPQAAAAEAARPEGDRDLGDDRHRALLAAFRRCAGGGCRRPRLSGRGALPAAGRRG